MVQKKANKVTSGRMIIGDIFITTEEFSVIGGSIYILGFLLQLVF